VSGDDAIRWWLGGAELPAADPPARPDDGAAARARLGDRIGGRYALLDVLGAGGAAFVYRARDGSGGADVALKLLRDALDAEQVARLRRERALAAALDHPGIVRLRDAGTEARSGAPFLVYDLVAGGPLAERLESGLSPAEAVRIAAAVARALGAAHRAGVVHRDVTPRNVLLDAAGRPRLTDFGLGWQRGLQRLTASDALVGTPAYLAPEQVRPRAEPVGPAADVWALGVVLYRALTGRLPFGGPDLVTCLARACEAAPAPPRALAPALDPALEAVCLRALAKRPAERYPDGGALAAALEALAPSP